MGIEAGTAAFDVLPDGLLIADGAGTVELVNVAGLALLHRNLGDVIGRDYREVLPLTDTVGRDWWACTRPYDGLLIRTGQPERRLTLPDERELYVTARYDRDVRRGRVRGCSSAFAALASASAPNATAPISCRPSPTSCVRR